MLNVCNKKKKERRDLPCVFWDAVPVLRLEHRTAHTRSWHEQMLECCMWRQRCVVLCRRVTLNLCSKRPAFSTRYKNVPLHYMADSLGEE